MKVVLTVVGGPENGREVLLTRPETLIGRDPKCPIHLRDAEISREHCVLLADADKIIVRDFGSANGTFINQRRLRGELELANGDILQVGKHVFSVTLLTMPAGLDADSGVLDELREASPSQSIKQTVVGKIQVIDPDALDDQEEFRLDDRLRDL